MKLGYLGVLLLWTAGVFAADSESIAIPVISGALTIDGKPDEAAWQSVHTLSLTSSEFGSPFPAGGEAKVATCGMYLCLSARIPEPHRIVAHSTGRNPTWWLEDLVTWNIRVRDNALSRQLNLSLTVNAVGAFRIDGASGIGALEAQGKVLAAARVGAGEWTAEAAIPLERFGPIGFIDIQRVRAPRPHAPGLRWYWPAVNERSAFRLSPLSNQPGPKYHPADRLTGPSIHGASAPPGELAWIPKNAWTTEQRSQLQLSNMLNKSLRARMQVIAEKEKLEWKRVSSRDDWERFRDPRLAALRAWMGPLPERTPLNAEVTRRADYGDGFVIENVVYESRPNLLVTANLYLPENPSGKIPAIVVVHSHHAPKTQSELQDLGMTWARAGVAVLIMDQLCAGERSQSQPWYRESYYGRYTLGNQLVLAGESLMKWMVCDLMRSVDLLLERPYIDSERIIMLGAVAGGGDPAGVTAALDPRIAAVIPFNFGEAGPEEHYTDGPRGYDFETAWPGWGEWETTRCLPRSVADQFFPWLICASVAPRPFLYSFEIGWPADVEHEPAWARYKKVYDLYSARDHLDEVHGFGPYPGPGECTNVGASLRKKIYPILKRWLNVPTPAAEYHRTLPDAALMCMTISVAAKRQPKPASAIALDLAKQRLALSRSQAATPKMLRLALQEKLGNIEPPHNVSAKLLWTKTQGGIVVEALAIESEPGITIPFYVLRPSNRGTHPMPATLAIAQGGKAKFLSARGDEILTLLRRGVAVCLPDVRGTGEIASSESRGPESMNLAASELMLGGTLLGAQLKDVRTVFRYLMSRADIDPQQLAIWGDSFAETNPDDFAFDQSPLQEPGPFVQHQAEPLGALLALLTGLYEDRVGAVAARGGLISFLSVLEDRFSHVPADVIVPGILEAADVPDIVEAQSTKAILLETFVDGRNRVARNRWPKSSSRLTVREGAGDPRVANWLSSQWGRK
jgi:dienelactone hydrolase